MGEQRISEDSALLVEIFLRKIEASKEAIG